MKGLIKYIKEDYNKTKATLIAIFEGKAKFRYNKKEFFKFDIYKILKVNGVWYLVIVLAFFVGYFVAAKRYEGICNNLMNEIYFPVNKYVLDNISQILGGLK